MKLALRTKYSLLILSLIISVVILFAALVFIRFRSTMSDVTSLTSREMETELLSQLEDRAKVTTLLLSENLINPVYHYNLERIYDLTKAVVEQKDVAYVYVYDTAGRIIHDGTKENLLLDEVLPDRNAVGASKPIVQRIADTLDVTVPIKIHDERLGGVKIGFSLAGLRIAVQNMETNLAAIGTRGAQGTVNSIATVAIGVTAFGLMAAIFAARGLTRPIKLLSTLSAHVGRGDYDVEIPIKRSDELGELARSFGKMAADLKVSAERSEGHLQRISALHDIDLAISSTLELPVVLNFLLDKCDLFLPSAAASTVRLLNRDTGRLEPIACRNLNELVWKAEEWKSGRGITNVVAETRAPLVVENICKDPRTRDREFFHRYNLVSFIGVPLIVKKELLGVLSAYTKEEHRFSTREVEFFSTLASQAAIAIHNSQLYEASEKQKAELARANSELMRREAVQRLLKELSQDTAAMDAKRLAEKATDRMREFLKTDILDIRIGNDDQRTVFSVSGVDPQKIRPIGGRARWNWVVEKRIPLSIADISQEPDFPADSRSIKALGVRGYLAAPIISPSGKVIGVLRALTYQARQFTKEDKDLLQELANGFPLVLEQFRLLERIKKQTVELERSNAQLQRSNRVKDEFLSVMSHELRTPLNVIVGYVEMVRDKLLGEMNEKQEKALAKVVARSSDLLSMIADILNVTRLEANEITLGNYEISLKSFLDDVRLPYDLPLNKDITLHWDCPAELPVVHSDGEKLKQILQNLIHNAVKFTGKGSVTVSARHVPEAAAVEFKVADTGVGIPKEKIPVIFEMFRQADSSETRSYGGVGLGLYIVKKFTELLGGKIEVESEPGKGSAFTVTIPVSWRTGAV